VGQKGIELILLRQWASYLATPIWVTGADGELLFYNEPAEVLVGKRYDEVDEMMAQDLATIFEVRGADGSPVDPDDLPLTTALRKRRPAHGRLQGKSLDGVWRHIELTAFPVEGQGGRLLGAVAIFWEMEKPS
jgi:PAS domain-containing protein